MCLFLRFLLQSETPETPGIYRLACLEEIIVTRISDIRYECLLVIIGPISFFSHTFYHFRSSSILLKTLKASCEVQFGKPINTKKKKVLIILRYFYIHALVIFNFQNFTPTIVIRHSIIASNGSIARNLRLPFLFTIVLPFYRLL